MERMLKRAGMAASVALLTAAGVLGSALVAQADNLQDTIADTAAAALVLEAGSQATASAGIRVVGNNAQGDPDDGCNIDPGDSPLVLDVIAPTGITATPDPLSITACGTNFSVVFRAGTNAVSGNVTVAVTSSPAGGGTYLNQVSIPITITQPAPANTKPTVSVQGVIAGSYEIGSVPAATCAVSDTEDGPSSFPAAISGALVHGLGTQTATCDHTDTGGLAADTATVTYTVGDTGLPTISHVLSPADANANGWYRTNVGVAFTCADSGSGIQSCGPDTVLYEGADQSYTGTATDWAGNSTSDTVSNVDIDTTDPEITSSLSPGDGPNSNGWYRADVVIDFECTDVLSGIESCLGDTTIGEGDPDSTTGTATDRAGNTAEAGVTGIRVDTSSPEITASLTPGDGPNSNGWYNKPVHVDFSCDDAVSGIDTCEGDDDLGEGENQSRTGTATDRAGNVTERTVSDIDIDLTAPDVAFSGAFGSAYSFGDVPPAPSCTAADELSGLASPCAVTGYGTGVGEHTLTTTATDRAGNVATATLHYTVLAWNLAGFFNPVDMGGVWNTVKNGSTVPLKFEVFSGATELISTAAIDRFTVVSTTCPGASAATDPIEFTTTGATALRYDATAGQFIQNWATPKKAGTCVVVTMTTDDGSSIAAKFILK